MRTNVAAVLALASAIAACRDPTQVDVALRTDTTCANLQGVELAVGPTPDVVESRAPGAATRSCDAGEIGNIVLVPDGDDDASFSLRVVAGFKKPAEDCRTEADFDGRGPNGEGCIEAKRALAFIPHTPLRLPIDLRESCVGVPCPVDETCVAGECVPAAIRCEDAEPCDEDVLSGSGSGGQGGAGGAGGAGGQGGAADPVVAITAGHHASCARFRSGSVVCWGANHVGQLGNGMMSGSGLVAAFSSLPDLVTIGPAIGAQHGCVGIAPAGSVYCAGEDGLGALGNGTGIASSPTPKPVQAMTLGSASRIDAGGLHVCALDAGGLPYCWGQNASGQCAKANSSTVQAPSPLGNPGWKAISAGALHSCGVESTGVVLCWGSNTTSQAGQSSGGSFQFPQVVLAEGGGALTVDDVSAGTTHTCALGAGSVSCWGLNDVGQICADPGLILNTYVPQTCALPTSVLQLEAAGIGTCALGDDDGVYCWGDVALAPDSRGDAWVPKKVYDNAAQIAVGDDHACALTHGGQVVCWGKNDDGQVDGAPDNQILKPKLILGPP